MELSPTHSAILAIIGGVLSAGGLASKVVDWARSRSRSRERIDAKQLDVDLTLNDRLFVRIRELETALTVSSDRARDAENAERAGKHAADERVDAVLKNLAASETNNEKLLDSNRALARELETTRSDLDESRRHADRLEAENRRLRDTTQSNRLRPPRGG